MKPINLNNVQEQQEGEFPRLKPGAYPCAIMAVEDFPEKEYMRVLVDIASGEFANFFSDDFYRDKPFAHSLIFSYKPKALGMLKGRLHVISDCNQGFDAEAAINAGKEQMLVGKAVGVVFREEEYYDAKSGEFKMGSPRPDRLCRLTEMTDPRNADPQPRMLTDARKREAVARAGAGARAAAPAVDVYDGDIPFM